MILAELKTLVNALTGIQSSFIVFSRNGYDRKNLNWSGAHIDELAILPVGRHEDYDEDTEEQTLTTQYNGTFTIDFYGDNALANSTKFINSQHSLASYEWQRDNNIRISHANRITNLKAIDNYSNMDRYQVEFKANFYMSTVISTKRIDTAVHSFLNEE